MKTPSLYSQDDPITEALRPPPTETEAERFARLQSEAEAKRISEQIDEDLRQERENLKRKKTDVKVRIDGNPQLRRIYSLIGAHIATLAWPGGERQVDAPETIPTHVQTELSRPGKVFMANGHLFQCRSLYQAYLEHSGSMGRLPRGRNGRRRTL